MHYHQLVALASLVLASSCMAAPVNNVLDGLSAGPINLAADKDLTKLMVGVVRRDTVASAHKAAQANNAAAVAAPKAPADSGSSGAAVAPAVDPMPIYDEAMPMGHSGTPEGMSSLGLDNLVDVDLANNPVNHILTPHDPSEKLVDADLNAASLINTEYEGMGYRQGVELLGGI
ncbi:hypothetical protein BC940DRAFT_363758 [Gongronella butleri]|nr:hypothetical protein BC940DRAFT_363758 [Gongronella butleri]